MVDEVTRIPKGGRLRMPAGYQVADDEEPLLPWP